MGRAKGLLLAKMGGKPPETFWKVLLADRREPKTGDVVRFFSPSARPLRECSAEIRLTQSGSGDPSPSNIRPIMGWTGTKLSHCGGNLVPDSWYSTSLSNSGVTGAKEGDSFVLNGVSTSSSGINWYIKRYDTASEFSLPAGTYTLSGISGPLADNAPMLSLYKRENGSNVQIVYCQQKAGLTSRTVTLTEYTEHLFLVIVVRAGSDVTGYTIKPMLEPGEDASEFSPYGSWNAINVPFPSDAGTVYGGTVDLVSGVLTVTHGYVTFNGTEAWNRAGTDPLFWRTLDSLGPAAKGNGGVFSHLPYGYVTTNNSTIGARVGVNNGSTRIYLRYAGMPSTVADWQATLAQWHTDGTSFQAVYEMATPVTYQLTPQEVTALAGVNHVWADCGPITVRR